MTRKLRSWGCYSGSQNQNYCSVTERHDGQWLASYGPSPQYDPPGTAFKQETFSDLGEALKFIGYPVSLLPIPECLNWIHEKRPRMASCGITSTFAIVPHGGTASGPKSSGSMILAV